MSDQVQAPAEGGVLRQALERIAAIRSPGHRMADETELIEAQSIANEALAASPDVQPKGTDKQARDKFAAWYATFPNNARKAGLTLMDAYCAGHDAAEDAAKTAVQSSAPGAVQLPSPITEEMHVAACKVLTRAHGLDGLPQRMLDAMRAAAPAQCAAVAQPNRALAAEVLRVCASISQHIEQGVASEALEAARRPGYGTGIYTYLKHRVEDLRAAARAEVQPPVQPTGGADV